MSDILAEIKHERERQVSEEGWTHDHDDLHVNGELAAAASAYALHASGRSVPIEWAGDLAENVPTGWMWSGAWWKPKTQRRDLVRAAALIVAEIERLDRKEAKNA